METALIAGLFALVTALTTAFITSRINSAGQKAEHDRTILQLSYQRSTETHARRTEIYERTVNKMLALHDQLSSSHGYTRTEIQRIIRSLDSIQTKMRLHAKYECEQEFDKCLKLLVDYRNYFAETEPRNPASKAQLNKDFAEQVLALAVSCRRDLRAERTRGLKNQGTDQDDFLWADRDGPGEYI